MKNTCIEYLSTERTPTVLPAFAELLPPLPDDRFSMLEADILQNGCYSPIIVNEDMVVIDGHNRLNICEKHGIPYRMAVFSFEDNLEAKQWALDTQKGRRNLTMWDLGQIALKLKPEIEAKAKKNSGTRTDLSATLPAGSKMDTRKELAGTVGLGERTMGKVMQIDEHAPVPVKEALDKKEISINQGYNITKEVEALPEEEQEQAAMEAVKKEIARKDDAKRKDIHKKSAAARQFCSAFEHGNLLKATDENICTWVEQCGISYEQLDRMICESKEIARRFLYIAEYLESEIKAKHWRNTVNNDQKEHAQNG